MTVLGDDEVVVHRETEGRRIAGRLIVHKKTMRAWGSPSDFGKLIIEEIETGPR